MKSFRIPAALGWSLIGMVILKLVLVSNEEILAFYLPHDDLWHIRAAERFYWFSAYSSDSLLHLPIYPLFVQLVHLTGLPLRMGAELVYCGGACCLSISLWRLGCGCLPSIFAAAATILLPASFQIPNRAGAEVLLAPLMMFALAGSLTWWSSRGRTGGWRTALLAGTWWALAWNTRKESILLLAPLGALALCLILADRREGFRGVSMRLAAGVGIPLAMCILLASAISAANHARWGLYSNSILTSPGFKAAYKALQSIPPEHPLHYISVPVEVRNKAYEASARFAKLRPCLEGDIGRRWAAVSRTSFTDPIGMTGLDPMEIANGWFYWALHDAVIASGNGKTPAAENLFLLKVAEQIHKAQRKGLLERRWVPVAMIESDWRLWLPGLPASIARVSSLLTTSTVNPGWVYDDKDASAISWMFDKMANRRAFPSRPREGLLSGWITSKDGKVPTLTLFLASGAPAAQTTPDVVRPDVDRTLATGFALRFSMDHPELISDGFLRVSIEGSGSVDIPAKNLATDRVLAIDIGSSQVVFQVDLLDLPVPPYVWSKSLQGLWEKLYLAAARWAAWSLVAVWPALIWIFLRRKSLPPCMIAFCLFAAAVAARIAFFALLDATSWPAEQPRYLFPVMPLYAVLLVTAVSIVLGALADMFRRIFSASGWTKDIC